MRARDRQGENGEIAVKVVNDIDAKRHRGAPEPGGKHKLHTHHGERRKTERHCKIPPETAGRGHWPQ
jgi:hypothetical protein